MNFKGTLYGKMGSHKSKGIHCCPHGDAKFVRFVNRICRDEEKIKDVLKISCTQDGLDKILVESAEPPALNLFERILYNVEPLQNKAVRMRQSGKIQSFVFRLNELEYKNLWESYLFITKGQLKRFESNIINAAEEKDLLFIEKFFGIRQRPTGQ